MGDLFQWKFTSDTLSLSLANCVSLPIVVQPFNATNTTGSRGVPPYYMHAFAIDGIPTTTLIGTDNQTLSWTPTHPPNTRLLLKVVDSMGTSGGVSPSLYTVIAGQSTQCVVDDTHNDFTVSSNVKDLSTCDPWQLKMEGGVPPYNVTLAALNSPIVTNVTMPFGDDVFVYINRADPGTQLVAGVSDFTGRWAKGTPIVSTKGSTDVSCTGKTSFSANSTTLESKLKSQSGSGNRTAIIIAICVPVGLVIIAAAFFIPWYRRRRKRDYHLVELIPRRFEDPNPKYNEPYRQPPPITPYVHDEVVVQHRDGGNVHELPPPYVDRTLDTPT